MFFYFFLDPQIISDCAAEGSDSIEKLESWLEHVSANCFWADFDNWNVQNEIRQRLGSIVGDFSVVRFKKIVEHFWKANLFVNCLAYDYTPNTSMGQMAIAEATSAELDILLLGTDEFESNKTNPVVSCLTDVRNTNFHRSQTDFARNGIEESSDAHDESVFMDKYLKKPLKFADKVEIIDYQCGEKYKPNYDYNLGRFLRWLQNINQQEPTIIFHLGFPSVRESDIVNDADLDGLSSNEIEPTKIQKLKEAIQKHAPSAHIVVHCYTESDTHNRYVVTNQVAFFIDRGIDFLNPQTRKNRRISMGIKDGKKILSSLPAPAQTLPQ